MTNERSFSLNNGLVSGYNHEDSDSRSELREALDIYKGNDVSPVFTHVSQDSIVLTNPFYRDCYYGICILDEEDSIIDNENGCYRVIKEEYLYYNDFRDSFFKLHEEEELLFISNSTMDFFLLQKDSIYEVYFIKGKNSFPELWSTFSFQGQIMEFYIRNGSSLIFRDDLLNEVVKINIESKEIKILDRFESYARFVFNEGGGNFYYFIPTNDYSKIKLVSCDRDGKRKDSNYLVMPSKFSALDFFYDNRLNKLYVLTFNAVTFETGVFSCVVK